MSFLTRPALCRMPLILRACFLWVAFLAPIPSAEALHIIRTDDPSLNDISIISNANANAARSAFDYVAAQLEALYSDPVNIRITLKAVAGTSILGHSQVRANTWSYTTVRTALISRATTLDDNAAIASLPATAPVGATDLAVTTALGKVLGLVTDDGSTDGTFNFGAGWPYTFDPSNRAVAGSMDFIGVAYHEITEVMDRIAPALGSPPHLIDLYAFSAPGVRSLTQGPNVWFSIDGGTTLLKQFNPTASGDRQDWAISTGGINDAFNAFTGPSVMNPLTTVDLRVMDVIGYTPKFVAGGEFENPPTSYVYAPPVTASQPWTFATYAGISNNYGFAVSGASAGQFAFLQSFGSNISQSMYLPPGNYQLSYRLAARYPVSGTTNYSISVSGGLLAVNGSLVTGQPFSTATTVRFTATNPGNYTLTFANTTPAANGDQTFYVDSVAINRLPGLTAPTSTTITSTGATLGGNVTSGGGESITESGVVYALTSVNSNPQIGGTGVTKVTSPFPTTGIFTVNIAGLSVNNGYSYKAYATNSVGTTYTSAAAFTTAALAPTVTTLTLSNVTSSSATLGGTVSSDGGAAITERGVVYALTSANASPAIGGSGVTKAIASGTTGAFTTGVATLSANSRYSFTAYATNSVGTTYSSAATFHTIPLAPPAVSTPTFTNITSSGATLGGNVVSDGGATITERGIVYALSSVNSDPLIGDLGATKIIVAGTTGAFSASVTALIGNSSYSFNAYATNSQGTSYTDFPAAATFTTAATGPAGIADWAAGFGISGADANPAATPFNDGVTNLLKYAFNIPLTGPNVSRLLPGTGTSGLPCVTTPSTGGPPTSTRVEFIRRRSGGLIYTPLYSINGLNDFKAMTASPVVTPIDATWERVVVDQPLGLPLPRACFSRVSVQSQ
ncbi:MAG: NF038122 family metalloprotease [Verrucomicrobiota bacterium]